MIWESIQNIWDGSVGSLIPDKALGISSLSRLFTHGEQGVYLRVWASLLYILTVYFLSHFSAPIL